MKSRSVRRKQWKAMDVESMRPACQPAIPSRLDASGHLGEPPGLREALRRMNRLINASRRPQVAGFLQEIIAERRNA